ncbi:hypothetical protein E8E12_000338 [Didymella heteroderae]|uniref:Uncharacterized protein n=1 Tax=Didymella heteroderae TaxID=1769908 RepID=A0A9P5BYH2_9PLEO|nr:hypothetical protein E8E12_000338 [Didymella heteroderae]
MHPHDNRLKEIRIEPKKKQAQLAHRTTDKDLVIKEETPDKKRKHDEIGMVQANHRQSIVDTARAVDMDDLHFNEPFPGFNYAANPDNTRFGPYHYNTIHIPDQPANHCHAFYKEASVYSTSTPELPNFGQYLSGDTLMPGSFVTDSYGATHSPYQNGAETFVSGSFGVAEPLYTNDVDPFSSSSFGDAEPSHVGSAETLISDSFRAEPTYTTSNHILAPAPFAAGPDNVDIYDDHDGDFEQDTQKRYNVSAAPAEDSEFAASESEDERPRKTPKLNKDGVPRKSRQPRPKLLKWSDDDWKNVCLGIVWACGETGVRIPFEQAAQVVGEKCTAGALQQALLKLRGKQIDAGHSIPNLKMAWTRKNKSGTPGKAKASVETEVNKTARKKPTRFEATQSLIVTLPRAYTDEGREGLQAPYRWKKPPKKNRSTHVVQGSATSSFPYTTGGSQHLDYLPATPPMNRLYNTPPVTPFGNNTGYLQGMVLSGGEFTNLLNSEGLHEVGNGWCDAADDVFGL